MAFGEQQPMIQIQVDQRLALESAVHGDVEDTSVSTEITQFDKVGDSYILEGMLAFSGSLQDAFRNSEEAGQKAPFEYRLPFALKIPIEGQPDYLKVNTRIRDWKLEHSEPSSLNFQAELTILGLNGNRGYYFYCGDQEDWVQPAPEEVREFEPETDSGSGTEPLGESRTFPDDMLAVEVEGLDSKFDEENARVEEPSYNEQEWMIETPVEKDEQDTLIYQPGWQEELQTALAGNFVQEEEDESRAVEAVEDEYQFEALADEVVSGKTAGESVPAAEQADFASAMEAEAVEESVQAAVAQAKEVVLPEAEETAAELVSADQGDVESADSVEEEAVQAAADSPETPLPDQAEAKADGPKLSFGKAKEETSPVKLSGLLYGSVTEPRVETPAAPEAVKVITDATARVETADTETVKAEAADAQMVKAETAEEEVVAAVTDSAAEAESVAASVNIKPAAETESVAEAAADASQDSTDAAESPSIWGKWIQTDSALTYTIKFRIVQEEETLQELANGYNTPIETLMRANGLTNENINVGQVLLIPGRR